MMSCSTALSPRRFIITPLFPFRCLFFCFCSLTPLLCCYLQRPTALTAQHQCLRRSFAALRVRSLRVLARKRKRFVSLRAAGRVQEARAEPLFAETMSHWRDLQLGPTLSLRSASASAARGAGVNESKSEAKSEADVEAALATALSLPSELPQRELTSFESLVLISHSHTRTVPCPMLFPLCFVCF